MKKTISILCGITILSGCSTLEFWKSDDKSMANLPRHNPSMNASNNGANAPMMAPPAPPIPPMAGNDNNGYMPMPGGMPDSAPTPPLPGMANASQPPMSPGADFSANASLNSSGRRMPEFNREALGQSGDIYGGAPVAPVVQSTMAVPVPPPPPIPALAQQMPQGAEIAAVPPAPPVTSAPIPPTPAQPPLQPAFKPMPPAEVAAAPLPAPEAKAKLAAVPPAPPVMPTAQTVPPAPPIPSAAPEFAIAGASTNSDVAPVPPVPPMRGNSNHSAAYPNLADVPPMPPLPKPADNDPRVLQMKQDLASMQQQKAQADAQGNAIAGSSPVVPPVPPFMTAETNPQPQQQPKAVVKSVKKDSLGNSPKTPIVVPLASANPPAPPSFQPLPPAQQQAALPPIQTSQPMQPNLLPKGPTIVVHSDHSTAAPMPQQAAAEPWSPPASQQYASLSPTPVPPVPPIAAKPLASSSQPKLVASATDNAPAPVAVSSANAPRTNFSQLHPISGTEPVPPAPIAPLAPAPIAAAPAAPLHVASVSPAPVPPAAPIAPAPAGFTPLPPAPMPSNLATPAPQPVAYNNQQNDGEASTDPSQLHPISALHYRTLPDSRYAKAREEQRDDSGF